MGAVTGLLWNPVACWVLSIRVYECMVCVLHMEYVSWTYETFWRYREIVCRMWRTIFGQYLLLTCVVTHEVRGTLCTYPG